jgi:hypothetical protein
MSVRRAGGGAFSVRARLRAHLPRNERAYKTRTSARQPAGLGHPARSNREFRTAGVSCPQPPSRTLRSRPRIILVKRGSRVRIPPSASFRRAKSGLSFFAPGSRAYKTRTKLTPARVEAGSKCESLRPARRRASNLCEQPGSCPRASVVTELIGTLDGLPPLRKRRSLRRRWRRCSSHGRSRQCSSCSRSGRERSRASRPGSLRIRLSVCYWRIGGPREARARRLHPRDGGTQGDRGRRARVRSDASLSRRPNRVCRHSASSASSLGRAPRPAPPAGPRRV